MSDFSKTGCDISEFEVFRYMGGSKNLGKKNFITLQKVSSWNLRRFDRRNAFFCGDREI